MPNPEATPIESHFQAKKKKKKVFSKGDSLELKQPLLSVGTGHSSGWPTQKLYGIFAGSSHKMLSWALF